MSLTYAATVAGILAQLLSAAGIDVSLESLNTTVSTVFSVAAGLVALYGRVRAGGITWFGTRTK